MLAPIAPYLSVSDFIKFQMRGLSCQSTIIAAAEALP